ncbi:hypothetical protein KBD33_05645 [Candidatus Gracilibacteria bacterium]|nr:hypothetical protein [Candidatus Gracilibacteria bacterium]
MKHTHSSSHQEGRLLTETISLYSSQIIPRHLSFHIHELQDYVKHFI